VVAVNDGKPVYVRDIADVYYAPEEAHHTLLVFGTLPSCCNNSKPKERNCPSSSDFDHKVRLTIDTSSNKFPVPWELASKSATLDFTCTISVSAVNTLAVNVFLNQNYELQFSCNVM
jgi:hypothetical protein